MSADAASSLAAVVLVDRPLEDVLDEIAGIAHRVLPQAEGTSITLLRDDRGFPGAVLGPMAEAADELQYHEGNGPCLDAGRTGLVMLIEDTKEEDRWPAYTAKVQEHGVRSSLSTPLPFQGRSIGGLNWYSGTPGAFSADDIALAEQITPYIGVAVMNAEAHAVAATTARQMKEALESRKIIDMALGVLIATHHCTPDEAFALLSRTSQNHNRKLRDLAAALVEAEGQWQA